MMYQQGIADYGGRPKLRYIKMVVQRMADRIYVVACDGWHRICQAMMPWRKIDNTFDSHLNTIISYIHYY